MAKRNRSIPLSDLVPDPKRAASDLWWTLYCDCGVWIQGGQAALREHQRIVCQRPGSGERRGL